MTSSWQQRWTHGKTIWCWCLQLYW